MPNLNIRPSSAQSGPDSRHIVGKWGRCPYCGKWQFFSWPVNRPHREKTAVCLHGEAEGVGTHVVFPEQETVKFGAGEPIMARILDTKPFERSANK